MEVMNKRALFFSIDALIALFVIVVGIFFSVHNYNLGHADSYMQEDLIKSLSNIRIGDYNDSTVRGWIGQGIISDLNKSVIEQIGEFYVTNSTLARSLAKIVFDSINSSENIGMWFGDEYITSKNSTHYDRSKNVIVERQIISGIQAGSGVTAYSGRAFLSNNLQNEYYYFGGYVGEGNLSTRVEYNGNISSAILEVAINRDFKVYVNGKYAGSYVAPLSVYEPGTFSIPIGNFTSGVNIVELRGDKLSIAGGFLKISYLKEPTFTSNKRYYFPGINGAINLFDGLSIPNTLNSMNIFLHFNNSNFTIFLNIGNKTVYNGPSVGEKNISLNNTYLSSVLNYNSISNKTIPLRFGIENASFVVNISKPADVVSVNDLSGSMVAGCSSTSGNCCRVRNYCNTQATCTFCGRTWEDKIGASKNATKNFIDIVLNTTNGTNNNRVGLVGYKTSVAVSDTHNLSNNNISLKNKVNYWTVGGMTCICCGINSAMNQLANYSSSSKFRSMVVMSDGLANQRCSQQGTGSAVNDAIQAACQAYNNYGIIVYAIGFGADVDETTLTQIASCGHGSYYYGDVNSISEVYRSIAGEIINASFFEQTLIITGNYTSRLYPDSYIEMSYAEGGTPFGLITTTEKRFDDSWSGIFNLPSNSSILKANVISYSGPRWTDKVLIGNFTTYNLSVYGSEYLELGDPYSISIPLDKINKSNRVNLTTAISPYNNTGGSIYNKIIYTVLRENLAAYSSLSGVANGCNWSIEFESGAFIGTRVPTSYVGNQNCYYTSSSQTVANSNDALQESVLRLFRLLDYDSDGRVDVGFNQQDLQISSSQISGIPYSWSSEIQVRTWR